jgi:hypothetical protein
LYFKTDKGRILTNKIIDNQLQKFNIQNHEKVENKIVCNFYQLGVLNRGYSNFETSLVSFSYLDSWLQMPFVYSGFTSQSMKIVAFLLSIWRRIIYEMLAFIFLHYLFKYLKANSHNSNEIEVNTQFHVSQLLRMDYRHKNSEEWMPKSDIWWKQWQNVNRWQFPILFLQPSTSCTQL